MNLYRLVDTTSDPATALAIAAVSMLFGISALLFGRRLFWLAVAAAGFLTGMFAGPMFFGTASPLAWLIIATLLGGIGALLAITLDSYIVTISGFFGVGVIGMSLAAALGAPDWLNAAVFLAAGAAGAAATALAYDRAIMLISVLLGAALLAGGIDMVVPVPARVWPLLVLVLAAVGLRAQLRDLAKQPLIPGHLTILD